MKSKKKLTDRFSEFGIRMLKARYLLPDEEPLDLFTRVAKAYSDNKEHESRILDYILNCWFMPATPILSNGGTKRGLPISCFLNETQDSLESIVDLWHENAYLASRGGGIGTYWGNVRSIGEKIAKNGETSGIIPFIKVMDSLTLAISQGSLRRGSAAVYLNVDHPEIEEFIEIRKPTGGDFNRKCLNIHHAVVITNQFIKAIEENKNIELKSPATGKVIKEISARELWIRILTTRLETGEPYLLFKDNVEKEKPETYKYFNLEQKTSNLCSEITLATGLDQFEKNRTAVCCLSSVNLEYYDEWKDCELFVSDILRFLDNVLDDFYNRADDAMKNAKYSVKRERSIGLGVMGFHSYLQKNMIPFESVSAKSFNLKVFKDLREKADKASKEIAIEKAPCLDNFDMIVLDLLKDKFKNEEERDLKHIFQNYYNCLKNKDLPRSKFITEIFKQIEERGERFTHKLAIAPTASISQICGGASPCIEPFIANTFSQKNLTGLGSIRNKYLAKLLEERGKNSEEIWQTIISNEGSVQHLNFLTQKEKDVFKTAFEIDQAYIIEYAADRNKHICQAQSTNLFILSNTSKAYLNKIHLLAAKSIKSLYYLRSKSVGRGEKVNNSSSNINLLNKLENDECLSCQ